MKAHLDYAWQCVGRQAIASASNYNDLVEISLQVVSNLFKPKPRGFVYDYSAGTRNTEDDSGIRPTSDNRVVLNYCPIGDGDHREVCEFRLQRSINYMRRLNKRVLDQSPLMDKLIQLSGGHHTPADLLNELAISNYYQPLLRKLKKITDDRHGMLVYMIPTAESYEDRVRPLLEATGLSKTELHTWPGDYYKHLDLGRHLAKN